MEDENLKSAKIVFKTLCEALDENGWSYEKDDDKLTVHCGVQGDDLPIPLVIEVDTKNHIVVMLSELPFVVPEKRRNAVAMAVSKTNTQMYYGSFDYDYLNGRIVFRMTSCYHESLIGKETLAFLVMSTCHIVDKFNDRLLTVATNEMTIEEVIHYMLWGDDEND